MAALEAATRRYVMGYRMEFWPRNENGMLKMLSRAGLNSVRTKRLTWKDPFESTDKAYDFFACTTSSWWLAKFPKDKVELETQKVRNRFERKGVKQLTEDIVFGYAVKP